MSAPLNAGARSRRMNLFSLTRERGRRLVIVQESRAGLAHGFRKSLSHNDL